MPLKEIQNKVIQIIKPGINRKAKVRRFTEIICGKVMERDRINHYLNRTLTIEGDLL